MRAAVTPITVVIAAVVCAAQGRQFRSSVDLVEVHVTVRRADGELVRDLTKDDFELWEDGRRRDIAVFSSDVQPITIAILLDRSGSMSRQLTSVAAAAEAFVQKLLPEDRASVGSLSWECQPFTSDKDRLVAALRSQMQTDFGSPIWQGLSRALTSLARESGRRAVLMFSDGDDMTGPPLGSFRPPSPGPCQFSDHSSLVTLEDVSRRAEREGLMVFAFGVEGWSGKWNDGDLRRIARDSGGERFHLKGETELSAAFARIADELHHQYLIGFVPAALDGRRHSLDVRVKRPGVTVRARRSYIAVKADGAVAKGRASSPQLLASNF